MSDFNEQLRRHYERQKLPPAKVAALLAAGRAPSPARRRAWRWSWAAAAGCALCLIVIGIWRASTPAPSEERIALGDALEAVREHFARPGYDLDAVSANPAELRLRLIAASAPSDFALPAAVSSLPSYGCKVLNVQGRQVYLICFFMDAPEEGSAGGAPMRQMTVTGKDGSMMKKDRPLVHLLVADRTVFSNPPEPGAWVAVPFADDWLVRARGDGELVYALATQSTLLEFEAAVGTL